MVGETAENFGRASLFLEYLGRSVHCRSVESGVTMTLINNQLAGLALDLGEWVRLSPLQRWCNRQLRIRALKRGWGDKDTTIIAKVLEELAEEELGFEK